MQKLKMARQTKSNKTENIGKGKVTPVQVAFIVDRYLSDFTQTRSTFRSEASHLLPKSPINEDPRSLLSLGAMLDEYVCLKEQKVFMELEKMKVQNLLSGMQQVMNSYNNASVDLTPPPPLPGSSIPKSGYCSAYTSPALMPASVPSNTADSMKFSTPNSIPTTSKRKGSKDDSNVSIAAKKFRTNSPAIQLPPIGKSDSNANTITQATTDVNNRYVMRSSATQISNPVGKTNKSQVQGSNIAKCLFNRPINSSITKSSGPKTPTGVSASQDDKSISPMEICSTAVSSKEATASHVTSTNHMIISSETIQVTPTKQIAYYSIERNHCVSTSSPFKENLKRPGKRDQVKSRLDFDVSDIPSGSEIPTIPERISTSESEKERDIFDLDLSNLDTLGANFSLTELLMCDIDIDGEEGSDYPCQEKQDFSPESFAGSPQECGNVNFDAGQITSQISSEATEKLFHLSEKDTTLPGSDNVRTVKSVTKRVQIVSPVKNNRSSRD